MDNKDQRIIRALQTNGRMTNQELAVKVNLSPSPCLRRLRNLENTGVIRGYTAEVNAKLYGLPVMVFVRVTLDKHGEKTVRQFENRINEIDQILECYVMSGLADYLLRIMVADLDDYERFVRTYLQPISGIASIDTSFVYGTIKKTGVFPPVRQS